MHKVEFRPFEDKALQTSGLSLLDAKHLRKSQARQERKTNPNQVIQRTTASGAWVDENGRTGAALRIPLGSRGRPAIANRPSRGLTVAMIAFELLDMKGVQPTYSRNFITAKQKMMWYDITQWPLGSPPTVRRCQSSFTRNGRLR